MFGMRKRKKKRLLLKNISLLLSPNADMLALLDKYLDHDGKIDRHSSFDIEEIKLILGRLKLKKKSILNEKKQIRVDFRQRINAADVKQGLFGTLYVNKNRTHEKMELRREREITLASYEVSADLADELILIFKNELLRIKSQ